jgi:hypothetical protein
MGIAFLVRILVMDTMGRHPRDGSAFKSESAADRQEIFNRARGFVSAMGEQPMVAHADSQASRQPPQEKADGCGLPSEEEKGSDSSNVEQHHEEGGDPIEWLLKCPIA